jgi:HAD superfamily hydrolase (TIGR01459 family)
MNAENNSKGANIVNNKTENIDGLYQISHCYDVFIFDLWGVIHDGITPFQHSKDTMKNLKARGKTVLILSNSPKRMGDTEEHLSTMGISKELYDGMYTSGQDCYDRLFWRDHPWYQALGKRFFHIGPARNESIFTEIGYCSVQDPADADFVLCSGTDGWCTTPDPFYNVLDRCLVYRLPMVCANQDLGITREGKEYICCGAISKHYEKKGGNVFYHGKPSMAMFERLFTFNTVHAPKHKTVMIGDSLLTDIAGANAFGIDSVFITSGIHWKEKINAQTFFKFKAFPTWVTDHCSW